MAPIPDSTEKSDWTAVTLTSLLSRLEQNLLPSEAENRYSSSYNRTKVGANLDYARTLLLRLEHDNAGLKIQSKRQQLQTDLQTKRNQIKRLNQRLHELNQICGAAEEEDDFDDDDKEEEEDNADSQDSTPSHAPATKPSPGIDQNNSILRSRNPQTSSSAPADTASTTALFSSRRSKPTSPTTTTTTVAQTETLLSHNRTEQESLTASLVTMASALKTSTASFAASLETDKEVVARAGKGLERSGDSMEAAGKRIGTLRRMSEGTGWWGRMLLYVWIAGLAVVAVLIVFVGPKLRF
ncbi:MAG: hypothetical protein M1822_003053 [Bathelium mastoideum]|nr:MAG: hypothetical protein M1822_003053 [Bathelium mastoideum]